VNIHFYDFFKLVTKIKLKYILILCSEIYEISSSHAESMKIALGYGAVYSYHRQMKSRRMRLAGHVVRM
jgi:hypothetical protein